MTCSKFFILTMKKARARSASGIAKARKELREHVQSCEWCKETAKQNKRTRQVLLSIKSKAVKNGR